MLSTADKHDYKRLKIDIEAEKYRREERSSDNKREGNRDADKPEHTGRGILLPSQGRIRLPQIPDTWDQEHRDGMDDAVHGWQCLKVFYTACQ